MGRLEQMRRVNFGALAILMVSIASAQAEQNCKDKNTNCLETALKEFTARIHDGIKSFRAIENDARKAISEHNLTLARSLSNNARRAGLLDNWQGMENDVTDYNSSPNGPENALAVLDCRHTGLNMKHALQDAAEGRWNDANLGIDTYSRDIEDCWRSIPTSK